MPLNYTAAPSSRISKSSTRNPLNRRSTSSPFSSHPRRKPTPRTNKSHNGPPQDSADEYDDDNGPNNTSRLPDTGVIASLSTDLALRDVAQALRYIRTNMFTPLPERATGMSSTRVAEVLNFRRALPPIVTVAHVHALLNAPTMAEREIVELVQGGVVRKIVVPGRGGMGAGVGEGLVLVEEWEKVARESTELTEELKQTLLHHLRTNPAALTLPHSLFTPKDATALLHAGFLTNSTQSWTTTDVYSQPSPSLLGTLTSLSSLATRAPSGSLAAVGGQAAILNAGGSLSTTVTTDNRGGGEFHLALPNAGAHLRLLTSARTHLLALLAKSPHREAPLSLLRERWDGGVGRPDAKTPGAAAAAVLPGKTRKWRAFYGLRFEWVLGECVGAGLVELFETGSVGQGVRATGKKG
ncbi:hypothetical protein FGG08_006608 [Glutinoglossum americanum]|uniref:Serine-threonine protein kinase 19 n=1 Tax=Glutinoglossum americanum TaxID=1670608 RepID=A0A9P8HXZ4_9PEZI|nr:hypothetical protein FGG08_006608 [Glutinoglossum americanum]